MVRAGEGDMSVQTEDGALEARDFRRERLTVGFVTNLVAMTMDVPPREIQARRRTSVVAARARQTAIYLVHCGLGWPLARAAAAFGRDRTTASHAVQLIEDLRDDAAFDARLSVMESCVRQAAGGEGERS
jgi:chromosomal replication initiation ATPase DnaA